MKIIECPRDAMQGLPFIATDQKVTYINQLLKVGFDTIDFGSFVSAKAIPQMQDTPEVIERLEWTTSSTKLLAIVANTRGASDACACAGIQYLGFPLSISETFQKRNTNKTIAEAFNTVDEIQNLCVGHNKTLVTYISMGFGNPYGDPYDVELVMQFADILRTIGVKVISLADTIGVSEPENISYLFTSLSKHFPDVEFGAHLHSTAATAIDKIRAAYDSGCRRFDAAIRGFGGCPMAKEELVGNIATETLVSYLLDLNIELSLDSNAFLEAQAMADRVFPAS
ncbi:MAG TPA: hydroxymethylglutaryl-CoA lyase [Chryseosolibacter sp.]|nr:hydroxymethylglutaryl-CoA lyase [Chryseosolibacter sp.]